jgi:hypothetical protein
MTVSSPIILISTRPHHSRILIAPRHDTPAAKVSRSQKLKQRLAQAVSNAPRDFCACISSIDEYLRFHQSNSSGGEGAGDRGQSAPAAFKLPPVSEEKMSRFAFM